MNANLKMMSELSSVNIDDIFLTDELNEIIDKGFVNKDGCVFLAALEKMQTNVYLTNFEDKIGFECFINSFHIDDYVANRYLDYACLFCNQILRLWIRGNSFEKLNAIISLDEFGAAIKFHIKRHNISWLADDLNKYEEAILETDKPIEF
ncbi:hypothetical protein [Yersinia rohdei]|uniref:hypothetical protein n=1 Tax=Yersinia rohdei TaxID=29485 RepID=UPI00119CADA5|nr:hypothetical protein [Yersinia rohdei]